MLVLCDWYEQNTWESAEAAANISAKETLELKLQECIDIFQTKVGGASSIEGTAWMKEHSMLGVEEDILNMGLWQKMSLNRLSWDKIPMDLV